jgi:hypothetical protein
MNKICQYCGEEFITLKETAKFCSGACRFNFHYHTVMAPNAKIKRKSQQYEPPEMNGYWLTIKKFRYCYCCGKRIEIPNFYNIQYFYCSQTCQKKGMEDEL